MTNLPRLGLLLIFFWCSQEAALAATCRDDILAPTPTAAFDLSATDGTVIHNPTGLMWSRCSLGKTWNNGTLACDVSATTHTWAQALTDANNSTLAGFTDWRLPNLKELSSIVERRCFNASINETVFPNTSFSPYWSASVFANNPNLAWRVFFGNGNDGISSKGLAGRVRLVRGGQLFDSFDTAQKNSLTKINSSDPNPSEVGQTVTVFFTVSEQGGAGIPTGQVTVTDGSVSCIGTLTAGSGSCDLIFATPETKTLTADYPGDDTFNPSSSEAFQHQVNQGIPPVKNIPTLSQWAMFFMSLLLGVLGMSRVKRSKN